MRGAHVVHPSSSPALRSQKKIDAQAAGNGVERLTDTNHGERREGGTAEGLNILEHGTYNQEPNSILRFSMEEEEESPLDAHVKDTTLHRVESDNVESSQGDNNAEEDQFFGLEIVKFSDRQMSPRREDEGGGLKRQKQQKGFTVTGTAGTGEEGDRQMDDHCHVTADVKVELVLLKLEVKDTLEEEGVSESDQGSLRVSSKSDDVHYRAKRGRSRKSEVSGMELPLRQRLGRTAKNKEEATTKDFGEGARESENGEVDSGREELVSAHKESCEEYEQEEKAAALAAVMEVHGTRNKGPEFVADFPGEAGVGMKKQCYSCKRFETPKSTIICDKCQLSYHLSCVKLKPKQALDLQHEQWQCPSCGLETGYDYWPLGRITPRHDRKSADPRRIPHGVDTTVATMAVAVTVMDAAGVMDGVGVDLATNALEEESGGHEGAGSKDRKVGPKDVKESHRDLVVSGSLKERTVSENSGSEVRRGRGRSKTVVPRGLKDEVRILDLEPGSSSGCLREVQQNVEARDLNTDVPAQALHATTHVAGGANMTYRPSLAENFGGPTISMSEDDFEKYKKEVQATMEDLRSFIASKKGNLEKGWDVVIKRRLGNPSACDKVFISPDKNHMFRSRLDVARYLGLLEGKGGAWKADATSAGSFERAAARDLVQKTVRGLKLPIRCGDISIESLGAVDSWLAHDDKCRPWPVGYRSTWHDSETGSFCISEVVAGGKVGATFRVTRKSCLTLSASTKVAVTTSILDKSNTSFIDEKEEKDGSHPLISEVQSYSAETTPGKDNSAKVDTIGEFVVEGSSPSEAWKLFARHFVVCCQVSSVRLSSIRSFCPHPLRRSSVVPFSARGLDGSAMVVNPDLGADQGGVHTEFFGNIHEFPGGGKVEEEVFVYQWLEEWLGNDRFGLSLPKVQLLFRDLSNMCKVEANRVVVDLDGEDDGEAIKMDTSVPPGWSTRLREKKIRDNAAGKLPGVIYLGKEQPNTEAVRMEVPYAGRFTQEVETVVPIEKAIPVAKKARALPPSGEPLTRMLPGELVGDVLQVWEFLCRFSDIIGEKFILTYEEFEAGLVDVGPASPVKEVLKPDGDGEDPVISTTVEVNALDKGLEQKAQPNEPGKANGSEVDCVKGSTGKEPNVMNVNAENIVDEVSNSKGGEPFTGSEIDAKPPTSEVGKQELEVGPLVEGGVLLEVQHSTIRKDREGSICETVRVLPAAERVVAFPDGSLNQIFVTIADAHILLLKLLLADLHFRIVGTPNEKKSEEPKKKGRKPISEILQAPVVPEFPDDVPINVVTWPELVRRYLITLVEVEHSGDLTDLKQDERRRLIRCLQGDGGVLCGALFTVVGVESDAQVLAEAEKELASRMPKLEEKKQEEGIVKEDSNASDESEQEPEWVEALRPVSKMATNVGARIRTKIRESLDLNPPEWARETLEWSISKDIFRGNASGPTKKAVMEILKNFNGSFPASTGRRRSKRTVPTVEQIMQRCRFVLRALADADKTEAFSFLVGGPEGYGAGTQRAMVARPLDFRTIDARLAAGAYGGSVEAFAADVRQIWKNVEFVHKGSSEMMELAASLSNLFEDLLQKQVISLMHGSVEAKVKEPKTAGAVVVQGGEESVDGGQTKSATVEEPDEGKLQKAPWEDEVTCKVCGIDEDYENIILCDNCDAEYHLYCLNPPLEEVPEGKWFCPTCVAVERGFPDGPGGDGEMVEGGKDTETPAGRLDGEDEQSRADGTLEDAVGKEEVKSAVGESAAQSFLKIIDANEYWQLSITERVQLLKFLCEEALKTAQVRTHLEKSLDIASDLQQQLRTLVADRRQQAAITAENQKMERQAKPEERQTAVVTRTPKAPTSQVILGKVGEGGTTVAQVTKLKLRSSDGPANPNISPASPRLFKFEAVATVEVAACETSSRAKESVEEAGKGGNDGQESGYTVVEGSSVITLDASIPISISVVDSKKRTQEKIDQNASEGVPLELLKETYALEGTPGRCNKRLRVGDAEPGKVDNAPVSDVGAGAFLKEGQVPLTLNHTGDIVETPQADASHVQSKIRTDGEEEKNLSSEAIDDQPEAAARDQSSVRFEHSANGAEKYQRASDECHDVAGNERAETHPLSSSKIESRPEGVHQIDCQVRAEGVDFSVTSGANNSSIKGKPTDPAAQSGREVLLRSCCKVVEPASSSGTSMARIIQAEGTSLPPRTPKRKLELNTNNRDVVETQKKLKIGATICNGVVKGKSEESSMPHVLDRRSEGKCTLKLSKKKGSKQSIGPSESAQGIPALGEVIDVAPKDMAEAGVIDKGSSIETAQPRSSGVKFLGSQGSGADQILRTSNVSGGSQVLQGGASTTLHNPISKLDTEIAQLELKLYNLTMRREHLGTDDLGREYWGLTGLDQRPLLVVSEGDHRGRAGFEGAGESKCTYAEQRERGSPAGDGLPNDGTGTGEKSCCWWTYKTEESVDALVAWLNPRHRLENALRASIYEWQKSFSKPPQSSENILQTKAAGFSTPNTKISNKEGQEAGQDVSLILKLDKKSSQKLNVATQMFPSLRATSILQLRYGSSSGFDLKSSGKKSAPQPEGRLTRCKCLEPLWRSRWHCQICHETYESSSELETHQMRCPNGKDPKLAAFTPHPHSKKKKKGGSGNISKGKKSLTPVSAKGNKQTKSTIPRVEGTQLFGERDNTNPLVYEENPWMTEEASQQPIAHRHATRSKTHPTHVDQEMDPVMLNSEWATTEEPMDTFFLSDFEGDLQDPSPEDMGVEFGSFSALLQDDDWGANLRPEKIETKKKKQVSGKKSSKRSATQEANEEALANFDYASMPMSFSTPDSTRDRILQIGCIADQGPTFAPALHFAPAFDPSLMIQPFDSSRDEIQVIKTEEYTMSTPPPLSPAMSPSEELDTKDFDVGRLDAVSWYDPQSSGEIPPGSVFVQETGDSEPVVHAELGATWEYRWDDLVSLPLVSQENQVDVVEGAGAAIDSGGNSVSYSEDIPSPSKFTLLPEISPENIQAQASVQGPELPFVHDEVQVAVPASANSKKPSRKFRAPEASLLPLEGEQYGVLRGLQMRLLDMEAAMGSDNLIPARSSPARRRAWRSLIKSAKCIYEMTKALVILEQMVRADCLKKTWCLWSSLSAAARSVTLSALALKLYALDAAVTYRREKVEGEQLRQSAIKTGKTKLQVEVFTSTKKKKK